MWCFFHQSLKRCKLLTCSERSRRSRSVEKMLANKCECIGAGKSPGSRGIPEVPTNMLIAGVKCCFFKHFLFSGPKTNPKSPKSLSHAGGVVQKLPGFLNVHRTENDFCRLAFTMAIATYKNLNFFTWNQKLSLVGYA